jgi:hypothetical protein
MFRLGPRLTLPMLLAIAAEASISAQPRGASQPSSPQAPPGTATLGALPRAPVVEPQVTVWLGHAVSDNVARSITDTSGSYDSLGLVVRLGHDSTRVEARLDGDLEFRAYSVEDAEVADETIGNLDGSANIGIVPGRLNWTFRGNRGQGARDPFAPVGPFNRESILTLGSGPVLNLPLGARTNLSVGSEYSTRRFGESANVDNDAVLHRLEIFRQASLTGRFGISFTSSDIDYPDVAAAPSYQIDRASLRYDRVLNTGRVIAAMGRNKIDMGVAKSDEPLLEFEWARDIATRSSLTIRGGRGFTDSGNFLTITSEPAATSNVMDVVISASPVERKSAEMSYRLNGTRMGAEIAFGSFDDAFLTNPALDNESTYTRVALNRTVSDRLTVNVAWSRLLRDATDSSIASPQNEDSFLSAWINRTLGRRFSLAFIANQYERGGPDSFDDRRYELRVGYTPVRNANSGIGLVGR